jgi:hypothetical protein
MRLAHANSKATSARSSIPFPNPHNTTRKDAKINMATRTKATSEDRDSVIRQRCGYKTISSYAESCSAPSSRRHVEDVNSVRAGSASHCTRHETCSRYQQTNLRPLKHPIPQPAQHNTQRCKNHMATRTVATSEDRDSVIRQRCACNITPSYSESCSAPSSQRVGCRDLLSRVCCCNTAGKHHHSRSGSGCIISLPPLHALGCRVRF